MTQFLEADAKAILNILLNRVPREDSLVWFYKEKGKFTVKSGYHVAVELNGDNEAKGSDSKKSWWDYMWNLQLPSKVIFFFFMEGMY